MKSDTMREVWNNRADSFSAMVRDDQRPSARLYNDSWWGYIEPLLPGIPNGRILEAGCGPGRWAGRLVPMGFEVVLSDLSPKMLAKAREHAEQKGFAHKVSFEELDVCDLHTLDDQSFDMVLSTGESITLCSDPQQAISEYNRVLRPGGYLLCDASNRYRKAYDRFCASPSPQALHILETGEYTHQSEMTLHLLGPSEFSTIIENQGLEMLTMAGIMPMFSFPPDKRLTAALEDEKTYQAMVTLAQKHAQRPEIVHLSSRLIAVAHKPA